MRMQCINHSSMPYISALSLDPQDVPDAPNATADGEWALAEAEKRHEVSRSRLVNLSIHAHSESVAARIAVGPPAVRVSLKPAKAGREPVSCQLTVLTN